MLVSLKVPKAFAVPLFVSSSLQQHKPNLFSCVETSKYLSRNLLYAFQPQKTSTYVVSWTLNSKSISRTSFLLFVWLVTLYSLDFELFKDCTFPVGLLLVKTVLIHIFKHFIMEKHKWYVGSCFFVWKYLESTILCFFNL